jgi:patatin-related protein
MTTSSVKPPTPGTMPAPVPPPVFAPQQETRFAVVLYGGVSLAIYIHGVARELLHLVRATAPEQPFRAADHTPALKGAVRRALLAEGAAVPERRLVGSEKVYRKLGQILPLADGAQAALPQPGDPIRTRFVVDILSGTSAGGINGVFLAKALAANRPMGALRDLWVQEGDVAKLLNDKGSYADDLAHMARQDPPASLLNSRRLYCKLLGALNEMDESGEGAPETPFVDELDLYVTTTDIDGLVVPIQLSDRLVYERRHRNVFHFRYANEHAGGGAQDFARDDNPFLAFAARCTSAFPFAFEPMALSDVDEALGLPAFRRLQLPRAAHPPWGRFYGDYLRFGTDPAETAARRAERFLATAFGDGGYLDNKPFSYAIEAVKRRRTELPVDRKLLYVEPSPEHPEDGDERGRRRKPDAIENVFAAVLTLPRRETIREDLGEVRKFNRLTERVRILLGGRDRDTPHFSNARAARALATPGQAPQGARPWQEQDLRQMIRIFGPSYGAYHRLKVAAVTDELATVVTRAGGYDVGSDELLAIRYVVGHWRTESYRPYLEAAAEGVATENMFLFRYDIWWRMRRLHFLQSRIDELYALDAKTLSNRLQEIKELWKAPGLRKALRRPALEGGGLEDLRAALLLLKCGIGYAFADLRRAVRALGEPDAPAEEETIEADSRAAAQRLLPALRRKMLGLGVTRDELLGILGGASDGERRKRAGDLIAARAGRLQDVDGVARVVEEHFAAAMRPSAHNAMRMLGFPVPDTPERPRQVSAEVDALASRMEGTYPGATPVGRTILQHFYGYFEEYDLISFPVLYDTGAGEADPVEVIRISPEDASDLYDEQRGQRRPSAAELAAGRTARIAAGDRKPKLAGTTLANFGAFLVGQWRVNDMLWGRLDAAERLIGALLPGSANASLRRDLAREAQEEILAEELTSEAWKDLVRMLADAFHGRSGEAAAADARSWLREFAGGVRTDQLENLFLACLEKDRLPAFFVESSQRNREFPPEATLRTAARATEVVGRMLQDLAEKRPELAPAKRWLALVAWLGRVFWGFVEVAVPRSFGNLLARHWLWLLYAFELLAIGGGLLLGREEIATFGWTAFGITFAVHLLVYLLGGYMGGRSVWMRVAKGTLVGLLLALAGLGGVYAFTHLPGDLGRLVDRLRGGADEGSAPPMPPMTRP